MRRFRFVGDLSEWRQDPNMYDDIEKAFFAKHYPNEWQEVFEYKSKPIDNVTVELLDVALRICNISINKNLLDDLIDVIELLEDKGDNATIRDFEELKATWKA